MPYPPPPPPPKLGLHRKFNIIQRPETLTSIYTILKNRSRYIQSSNQIQLNVSGLIRDPVFVSCFCILFYFHLIILLLSDCYSSLTPSSVNLRSFHDGASLDRIRRVMNTPLMFTGDAEPTITKHRRRSHGRRGPKYFLVRMSILGHSYREEIRYDIAERNGHYKML